MTTGMADLTRQHRLLTISGEFEPHAVGQALDAIRETYRTFRVDGVDEQEFAAFREIAARGLDKMLDKPLPVAAELIEAPASGHDVAFAASLRSRLTAMDRGDLNRHVAEKFPALDDMLTIVVTPNLDGLDADCVIEAPDEVDRCSPAGTL